MDNHVAIMDRNMTDISNSLSEAAKWELLAEECSELAQAALKKARKLRGENYTPKSMEEIDASIEEEWVDVQLARAVCDLPTNWNIFQQKVNRWCERLKKCKEVNSVVVNDNHCFNPKKVAVEYIWYVTIPDILDLLDRFEYSTEKMIVRNGVWEIEDPIPIYCDNEKLPDFQYIFEGIGFFYQSWTRLPDVVINTEKQKLYILDKAHIDDFDKFSGKNSVFICLEFNAILEDETLTWADILKGIEIKHKASVNGDI